MQFQTRSNVGSFRNVRTKKSCCWSKERQQPITRGAAGCGVIDMSGQDCKTKYGTTL